MVLPYKISPFCDNILDLLFLLRAMKKMLFYVFYKITQLEFDIIKNEI
jgi:hypothetical protein